VPFYAHLPMILGPDGKRLSKRHGAVSVMQYREEGILPQALINYLVRLGWSHGDQEIFSIEELIKLFRIEAIHHSPAAVNPEKLLWLNQHYMKTADPMQVAVELSLQMQALRIDVSDGPALTDLIKVQAERTKTLKELAERSRYFYEEVPLTPEIQAQVTGEILPALKQFRDGLKNCEWSKEALHGLLMGTAEKAGLKIGQLAQPLRFILTGGKVSPPMDLTLLLLGRDKSLDRINKVVNE
jgi:glutamyl-tRNA synthetase